MLNGPIALLIVFLLIAWFHTARVRGTRRALRRRAEFLAAHRELSHDGFLDQLPLAADRQRRAARAIRHTVAKELDLPAVMIHPAKHGAFYPGAIPIQQHATDLAGRRASKERSASTRRAHCQPAWCEES